MRNILIIASLALNIFFIGFLAGGHFFGETGNEPDHAEQERKQVRMIKMRGSDYLIPHRAFESLPEELRDEARANLREGLLESREMHLDIRAKREAVSELLRQPSLDRALIGKRLDELHQAQEEGQRRAADAFIDVLAGLPDDERIALLTRVDAERAERHRKYGERWEDRKERYKERHKERHSHDNEEKERQ